jgi:hypothetical protein
LAHIAGEDAWERQTMTIGMNTALRRRLAGPMLGGLIAFAAVPAAMAQWLPPWRAMAWSGDIAGRLQAQGYVLIAPLQRRPGVYLADVRAGPAGYQRLVIDDRTGQILERFGSPPGNFGPAYAVRYNEFAERPPPGVVQSPYGPGFSDRPNGAPPARSAYGGPTNARIPSAISPFDSPLAPLSTKSKPKSAATARKIPPAAVPPVVGPPLPPPAPREAAKPDESAPPAPKPEPKVDSPPDDRENALSSTAPAAPEAKPEAAKIEPQPETQTQPQDSTSDPAAKPAAPASSDASDKSKVSIVPAAVFE